MANLNYLIAAMGLLFVLSILCIIIFISAIVADVNYSNVPCDQPLKHYLPVVFLWAYVPQQILKALKDRMTPLHLMWAGLFLGIPGYGLCGWGIYMVNTAETCQHTNPGLFYPTRRYIYMQAVTSVITVVMTFIWIKFFPRLLAILAKLHATPGCEDAVHSFPKIEAGAAELTNSDDGKVKACSICLMDLEGAVQTPCNHYFHEDCLATWCKNHQSCPLCREVLGEADATAGVEALGV